MKNNQAGTVRRPLSRYYRSFFWAMLAIGLLFPVFFARDQILTSLKMLSFRDLSALVALIAILMMTNVLRLALLLPHDFDRLSLSALTRLYLATEFFSKTTPAGVGAPLAAVQMLKPYDVPISLYAGVLLVCVLLDVLCVSSILLVSMVAWWFEAGIVSPSVVEASILLAGFCVGAFLLFLAFYKGWLTNCLDALISGHPRLERLGIIMADMASSLRRAFRSIFALGMARATAVVATSLFYWVLHLSVLYLVVNVLGQYASWGALVALQFLSMAGGHISMSPGGAGVVDVTALAGLSIFMEVPVAASVVLLWRFLMLYLYILLGGLAFFQELLLQRIRVR